MRIKRTKVGHTPDGPTPGPRVHYAKQVDRDGRVTAWADDEREAADFDGETASKVRREYATRKGAGRLEFLNPAGDQVQPPVGEEDSRPPQVPLQHLMAAAAENAGGGAARQGGGASLAEENARLKERLAKLEAEMEAATRPTPGAGRPDAHHQAESVSGREGQQQQPAPGGGKPPEQQPQSPAGGKPPEQQPPPPAGGGKSFATPPLLPEQQPKAGGSGGGGGTGRQKKATGEEV